MYVNELLIEKNCIRKSLRNIPERQLQITSTKSVNILIKENFSIIWVFLIKFASGV